MRKKTMEDINRPANKNLIFRKTPMSGNKTQIKTNHTSKHTKQKRSVLAMLGRTSRWNL